MGAEKYHLKVYHSSHSGFCNINLFINTSRTFKPLKFGQIFTYRDLLYTKLTDFFMRIKMHFSELRQLSQVWSYIGLKPTCPQKTIPYFLINSTQMLKNTFLPKNQKKGCGGFHFHLPVMAFYVLFQNLAPTFPFQFFIFSYCSSLM